MTAQVKMSGVLGELGRFEEARDGCLLAAERVQGTLRAIVLDTLADHHLALGELDAVGPIAGELRRAAGPLGAAGSFRTAQVHRLRGRLLEAEMALSEVQVRLGDDPRARSAAAAAEAELGEIRLMQGRYTEATRLLERAFSEQAAAGRGAPLWRAEAARIRVMVATGAQPLVGRLSEGVRYAVERGLVVLEGDLRFARGCAAASVDAEAAAADLHRAAEIGDHCRSPLRSGRARLGFVEHLSAGAELEQQLLTEATEALAFSPVWTARARVCRWLSGHGDALDRDALLAEVIGLGLMPERERIEAVADER